MKFKILTIFPEFFEAAINFSLLKKAQEKNLIQIETHNLRNWSSAEGIHKQIDDRPFGGGAGMVMMVEPVYKAIKELRIENSELNNSQSSIINYQLSINSKTIIFSPKGRKYDQILAEEFSKLDELILICPHYEGFDERILNFVDLEISIGDFVLTGGEIPALTVIDSVSRLIPGVLGNEVSNQTESFSELKSGTKNLEHPQFTRPATFIDENGKEYKVPEVLLSGNHAEIVKWRRDNSVIQ